jgi:Na+(H+)/acetate symporter ActP
VFGVLLGFLVIIAVSLMTRPGNARSDAFVDHIRFPG